MQESLLRLLSIVAGVTLSIQPAINGRLRGALGDPVWSSFVSFVLGAAVLAGIALVTRAPFPDLAAAARQAPWWIWTGGLCGVVYVTLALIIVSRLGSAALLSLAVLGMLLGGLVIDHFGFFGVPVARLSLTRAFGAALVVAGAALVVRT